MSLVHTEPGTELLEREHDLARLTEALDAARLGSGGMRLIEGPPGIGKSSLLAAAAARAKGMDMTCLSARAGAIERELPYGTMRQLLEGQLRDTTPARRERLLSGPAAPAAVALGLDGGDSPAPGIAAINGLFWLIVALAEEGPLACFLDDIQWADPDSIRFLAFATPRLGELPVLILAATRGGPGEATDRLATTASDPAVDPIQPRPLSAQACAQLAESALPEPLEPPLIQACQRASGGNPFYLRCLLDELARDPGDGSERISEERIMSLEPAAVGRVLLSRISGLEAPAATVSQAVAVLGEDSTTHLIGQVTELPPAAVASAVDLLAAAAILAAGDRIAFAHPIVRNVVYAGIERGERDRLHRRAAETMAATGIASDRIAAQLAATRPVGDPKTVECLRAAAAAAIGGGAPEAAMAHLRRALAEPPPDAVRRRLLLELANAELSADGVAARERLRRLLAETAPGPERVQIVRSLAAAHLSVGELGPLADLLRDEIQRADSADSALAAPLEADLAMTLLTGLDGASVREGHRRVERLAPDLSGESPAERSLLACLAYSRLCRGLPVDEVLAPLRLRLERAPDEGEEALPSADWLMTCGVLLRCGELELTERLARQGLRAARSSGSLYAQAGAHWVLGASFAAAGRLREAVPELESAVRGARDFGSAVGVHTALFSLVAVEVDRGELERAERALAAEGLERGPVAAVASPGELLESRAAMRLAQGDAEAALEDYGGVADYARIRGDLGPGMTLWRLGAALAHQRLGQAEQAERLAAEELARARQFGARRTLGSALVVAGQLEGGAAGRSLLDEAVGLLEGTPFRLELSRALIEQGAARRRAGRRAAARDPLRQALEVARAAGATPLAARAFEELRATGARPRKVLRTGVDALTPARTGSRGWPPPA